MKWTKKMGICLLLVMILNNGSCLWNQMISVKASEEPVPTGVMEMTKEECQKLQSEAEELDYINQHLFFAQSDTFMNRMDSRFSHDLKEGLDSRSALFAEAAYDLLDDVNSITKMEFNKLTVFENPYDAILAEILLSLSEQEAVNLADWSECNEGIKYGKASVEYVNKLMDLIYKVQPDCNIPKAELSTGLSDLLSDWKGMKQNSPDLYEKLSMTLESCMTEENASTMMRALDHTGKLFDGLKKFTTVLDNVQDGVERVVDLYNFYIVLNAYSEMSSEMLDSLHAAEKEMTNDIHRSYMNAALKKMDIYLSMDNIASALIARGLWKIGEMGYKNLATSVIQPAMVQVIGDGLGLSEAAVRHLYAVVKAYNVGWSLSDSLTKNDKVVECREEIRAVYFLAEAAYNVMAQDRDQMQIDPTYEKACRFDASYSILSACEQYALETYRQYLKAQQESFIHSAINVVFLRDKDYNREEQIMVSQEKLEWFCARCHTQYGISGSMGRDYIRIKGAVNVTGYDYENHVIFHVKGKKIEENTDTVGVSRSEGNIEIGFAASGVYRIELESCENGIFEVEFEKEDPEMKKLGPARYLDNEMKAGDCYRGSLYSSLTGEHDSSFTIQKYEAEDSQKTEIPQSEVVPETETEIQTEIQTENNSNTDWEQYIQEVLVPQYGVMPTRELSHPTTNGSSERWEDEQSELPNGAGEPQGLLSANVKDFDGDGRDEMLVTYWETMIVPHTPNIVTDLNLWMYEQDENGEIILTAEKKLGVYNGNGYGNGYIGYIQTGCMTWEYQENIYLGIDNYMHANESIATLDIYRYDGTAFIFEEGIGYQMQGNGDYYVRHLTEEDIAEEMGMLLEYRTFCGAVYGMNDEYWETVMEFHPEQPDGSYRTLSEEEAKPYFECYRELAGAYGLDIQSAEFNWRYAQEQDPYYQVDMRAVYQSMEGEITFLCGVSENTAKDHKTAYLLRCDDQGTLDAYRTAA